MIVEDLKRSLYLSCFQGKLSKTLESDSSVTDKLEEIISSKNIDKKEVKRRKINDEYSEPFEIPQTWKWVKLGYLCDVIRGLTFSSSYKTQKDNTILVLRGGNIDSKTEELVYYDNIYVDSNIPNENQYLKIGDTLIVASSGTKTSVGKSAYISDIDNNVSFGGFMMVVRPYIEIVNPKYVSYQIKMYRNKIINDTNGYISNITNEILNNLMIPLPPLEEQNRIVEEVERLFTKLNDIKPVEEELNELKKNFPTDMKKSILLSALKGNLTHQNMTELVNVEEIHNLTLISEPFEIPNNWKWISHNDLFEIVGGSQPPKSKFSSEKKEGFVQLYQTRDYGPNPQPVYVNKNDVSKFSKKGDMILARYGGSLGKVFWAEDGAYNVALAKVIIKYPDLINIKYLYYYYLGDLYQSKVKNGNRSAQAGFSKDDLSDLPFPLPPLEEQNRIVEKLEQLFPLLNNLENIVNEN